MSEENVEIVRRIAAQMPACYRTGGVTEAVRELLAPGFYVDASHRIFNPDVYEGADGMQRMIREVNDAWEDFRETTERILDAGEKVVVIQTICGRGRASGLEVQARGALVYTVTAGQIGSVEVYTDAEQALEAAGPKG